MLPGDQEYLYAYVNTLPVDPTSTQKGYFAMSGIQSRTNRHFKKHKNMTHNEENQSIETTQNRNRCYTSRNGIKTVLITYFHMFKKLSIVMGDIF